MKRTIILSTIILFCLPLISHAQLNYGATYYQQHKQYALSPNYNVDPIYLHIREVDSLAPLGGNIGTCYWVDGNAGDDSNNNGKTKDKAFKTIAAAIAAADDDIAVTNHWDRRNIIFVNGGYYDEVLTRFPEKTDIIGVGSTDWTSKATIRSTTATQTSSTPVSGTRFINMRFQLSGIAAPIVTLGTSSHGAAFIGCEFLGDGTTTVGLQYTASTDVRVEGCRFIGYGGAKMVQAISVLGVYNINGRIVDNYINAGIGIGIDISSNVTGTIIANNALDVTTLAIDDNSDLATVCNNRWISAAVVASSFDLEVARCVGNVATGSDETVEVPVTLVSDAGAALAAKYLDHFLSLDGATEKYPEQAAEDSILAKMLVKADPAVLSEYDNATDSQEMLSDKMGAFLGTAGAGATESIYALEALMHTDLHTIVADTEIWDTSGEARTLLFGSDTPGATQAQVNKIDTVSLLVSPVAGSLARFIASGGTGLGTSLADSKSLVDALGTNGASLVDGDVSIAGLLGIPTDSDNLVSSSTIVSNHDGSIYERLEGILQQVNDANALTQHAITEPINDSIAGYIGFDSADNAADTGLVVSNHNGSILERLEGIYLAVNDANAMSAHALVAAPINDSIAGYIGYDNSNNLAETDNVVSNHDGSILERLEGIILEVRDANALTQQAIAAPIDGSIAGYIGFNDADNAADTSTVASNHDGSILERLEGLYLMVNDSNFLSLHAMAEPINDSLAGYIGFDSANNAAETGLVVSNHDGSILERLEGIYLAVNDANAMSAHALAVAPINDSIAGYIGYDDADNAADTGLVVANHNGSILERLEGLHLAVHDANNLDSLNLDHLMSILDSTDADVTTVAKDSVIAKILVGGAEADPNNYDNTTMSLQALNADLDTIIADTEAMDTAEEIQALVDPNYTIHDAIRIVSDLTGNFNGNAYQTADSPVTIFTVTGDIVCRLTAIVNTSCTSTGNTGTLEVGVVGDTACLLIQDVVDNVAFQQNDVWTLTQPPDTPSAELSGAWIVIPNGLDIDVVIGTNDMTAGVIEFFLEWKPLSSGATVVGAAP